MNMNRIDPKDTPALFGRVGLEPVFGEWSHVNGRPCGCILTAMAAEKVGREEALGVARKIELDARLSFAVGRFARLLGIERAYALGLVVGWDAAYRFSTERYLRDAPLSFPPALVALGFEDGFAAKEAVEDARHSSIRRGS